MITTTRVSRSSKPRKLTLLSALAVLAIVELVMRLPQAWSWDMRISFNQPQGVFQAAKERSPSPTIVFMGSSLFRNGIAPKVVEDTLGLPEGAVANLAVTSGTPQDFLRVFENNTDYFRDTQVLLVEVGAFMFNWTTITLNGSVDQRFREFGSLSDKISIPGWEVKIDYVAGHFVQTWNKRGQMRRLLERIGIRNFSTRGYATDSSGQINLQSPGEMISLEAIDRQQEVDFQDFRMSGYQVQSLSKLVTLAMEDGIQVVLVDFPLSPPYESAVAEHHRNEDALWRAKVEEKTGLDIVRIQLSAATCSNWRNCYFDYGHVYPLGSTDYSSAMADWIRDELKVVP